MLTIQSNKSKCVKALDFSGHLTSYGNDIMRLLSLSGISCVLITIDNIVLCQVLKIMLLGKYLVYQRDNFRLRVIDLKFLSSSLRTSSGRKTLISYKRNSEKFSYDFFLHFFHDLK